MLRHNIKEGVFSVSQKHLFIADPLEDLNLPLDSSLRMARALAARGHRVFFTTIQ
ncbi:MAG: hypothetical protein EBU49_12265, partial [Proteobacteria bacterium]|nr:hypothetical protein [Pseudomonadota bacterium]